MCGRSIRLLEWNGVDKAGAIVPQLQISTAMLAATNSHLNSLDWTAFMLIGEGNS